MSRGCVIAVGVDQATAGTAAQASPCLGTRSRQAVTSGSGCCTGGWGNEDRAPSALALPGVRIL